MNGQQEHREKSGLPDSGLLFIPAVRLGPGGDYVRDLTAADIEAGARRLMLCLTWIAAVVFAAAVLCLLLFPNDNPPRRLDSLLRGSGVSAIPPDGLRPAGRIKSPRAPAALGYPIEDRTVEHWQLAGLIPEVAGSIPAGAIYIVTVGYRLSNGPDQP